MTKRNWIAARCAAGAQETEHPTRPAADYEDLIDLTVGDPDLPTPSEILEPAFADARAGHTKYTNPIGDLELRQEIRNYYKRFYGLDIGLDETMVTSAGCLGMTETMMRWSTRGTR